MLLCGWPTVILVLVPLSSASNLEQNFKLIHGKRVSSGGTQIQQVIRSGMTPIFCASLCGEECDMFHYSPGSGVCTLFTEEMDDPGVNLVLDSDWSVGTQRTEWTLVFRAQKAIRVSVYDTWTNTGHYDDSPIASEFPPECLRTTNYANCDRHFRSHVLDNWVNVKEVYYSLVADDSEVAYILFDGTGTSRDSWFTQSRILSSSWDPNIRTDPLSGPSIRGYDSPISKRRFYMYGPHLSGCLLEWFYTWVWDGSDDVCKSWVPASFKVFPMFFYSKTSGKAVLTSSSSEYPRTGDADVLAVYVKFV